MPLLCGLDLGQANDFTAFSALEKTGTDPRAEYAVRHLERFKIGTSYPDQVARVKALLATPELRGSELIVDYTGVGRPVVDMIRAAGMTPILVTIHGGDAVTHEGAEWRVPKRDLVSAVPVLLQSGRLKVARGLTEAQTLVKELTNFRVKINLKTAHDSYEAWREGAHDDLVLSVAMASWYGERQKRELRVL